MLNEVLANKRASLRASDYLNRPFIDRPLTNKEYSERGGGVCPYCGSTQMDCGDFSWDGQSLHQKITCLSCDKDWADSYILTGYVK